MKSIHTLMAALESQMREFAEPLQAVNHLQGLLVENTKIVLSDILLLNTAGLTGDRVSMKGYKRAAVIIALAPASGTDVAAVTMKQSKTVDDSPSTEKALSFSKMWKVADATLADALVQTVVASDTFNTSATAKKELFVIEILDTDLDINNEFDCIRVAIADPGSVSTPATAIYVLYEAKFRAATPPSAIVD